MDYKLYKSINDPTEISVYYNGSLYVHWSWLGVTRFISILTTKKQLNQLFILCNEIEEILHSEFIDNFKEWVKR